VDVARLMRSRTYRNIEVTDGASATLFDRLASHRHDARVTVLDCSTVIASVSERDYNELHLGDPVSFRVSGTDRAYPGRIVKLGSSTAFAIPFDPGSHQIVVAIPKLAASTEDGCAVGRTGEVIFGDTSQSLTARLTRSLQSLLGIS